jgi:toxin ParE1/3/4
MQTFTLASKALEDLKGIGRFTQFRWGRQQRLNYLAMLDNSFQQLAADPLIGQDASDIRRGYRKHRAGRHVIFYRQKTKDAIEIVRILHGRMDIETMLNDPSEQ